MAVKLFLDRVRPAPRVSAQLGLHLVAMCPPRFDAPVHDFRSPARRRDVDFVTLSGEGNVRSVVKVDTKPWISHYWIDDTSR